MDLVSSCKQKLAFFRIKELKDVLAQLGLSKQGKKQDLVDRILFSLSDEQLPRMWAKKNAVGKEEIAKLVEDAYRKMHRSGAPDLASKGHAGSDTSSMRPKEEVEDLYQPEYLIRCPCGSSLMSDSMIKCDDPKCHVWQHMSCVLIPEKPNEGLPHPEIFYCEICRLNRADPFWVPVAHPLHPVKLNATNIPADSTNPIQSAEKTFQLTRADKGLLSKQEYDVQAWCMLLNDKVLFRMQWPQYADLQVNGMPVRAVNRPGSQLLGTNGRDDGPIISSCTREGVNKISLTGCDARVFCLGVRIVKRRSVQQILNLIPKQSDGEPLEEALARVRRCVSGGSSADNADSDSDLEVVADCIGVNLRCPMSGSRMKVVGRFKPCIHMGCFDLEIFVEMNQRSRKWQCPICLRNYTLQDLIIDPYFNRITSMVRYCGEEVTEIEVKPDGSWRIKTKSENERRDHGDLAQWHFPDGSLCSGDKGLNKVEGAKQQQIKQEAVSEGHTGLKLGIRKNRNGLWEVSKPDFDPLSSGNKLVENYGNFSPKIIPMSSSASGSGRDGEDPSVNQEGGGNFDFSNNNGIELDSVSLNINAVSEFANRNPSSLPGGAEVIVLSDSEEENHAPVPSGSIFQNNQSDVRGINFSVPHPEISTSYPDDPTLGFFNGNDDEFEMPIWSMPSGPQARPGFQLFSSGTDALADMQHNSTAAASGFTLGAETAVSSAALIADSSCTRANPDMNDGLLDNSLAFSGNDPSLQIFLPTRPSDGPAQPELREQGSGSNGIHTEDWISLRLGGGAGGSHSASMSGYGSNSRKQLPPREGGMDTLADTASLLLGMNNSTSDRASRQRPDSPFSFPRQKRSVRPRLYLSIDSDTE